MAAGKTKRTTETNAEAGRRLLERWRWNVPDFAENCCGIRYWRKQIEIAAALRTHRYVAVKSGHSLGKSHMVAPLAIAWALTRERGRVLITAPTYAQVNDVLWRQLHAAKAASPVDLGGKLSLSPERGWKWSHGREIIGRTADKPEALQGYKSPDLLVIVDEASGYREELWPALMAAMTSERCRMLAMANPTRTSGTFFDAFHRARGLWKTFSLSAFDSPNVVEGRVVIPGLVDQTWIDDRRSEYGEDSPLWSVRVLGEFPSQADDVVIPLEHVQEALDRWQAGAEPDQSEPWVIGVDVARFGGDDTVAQPRRGNWAPKPQEVHGFDSVEVAALLRRMIRGDEAIRSAHEPVVVNIDMGGDHGAGVLDLLLAWNRDHLLGDHVTVHGVNPSHRTDDPERFAKMRDQLWWELREWLHAGGAMAPNPKLEAELVAPLYSIDSKGRRVVEQKEFTKKRLSPRRSPDRADALALAVHEEGAVGMADCVPERRPPEVKPGSQNGFYGVPLPSGAGSRWTGMGGKGF